MGPTRGVVFSASILLVVTQLCEAGITQSSWRRGQETVYEVSVEIPLSKPLGRYWSLYISFSQPVTKVNVLANDRI